MATESEYKESLSFVKEVIENYGYEFGVTYYASNETYQTKDYVCLGCNALFVASWPDWKVDFEHKPDCRYVKLMALMAHDDG